MHYLHEGSGDPVLLLHGEPTWAYLYRKLIPQLASVARVVTRLLRLRPLGQADADEEYSYDFHYASIERLTEELDLREATVVVQDWGGPMDFDWQSSIRDHAARLVILNTGIGAGRAPSPWLRFRDFIRRVGSRGHCGSAGADLKPWPSSPRTS